MWDERLPEPRLDVLVGRLRRRRVAAAVAARPAGGAHDAVRRPFDSIGFNLYRDGRDSVAWHGDRERYTHEQPTVAIVSLGAARSFMLRPARRLATPPASRSVTVICS